jgi:hypothetical protein
MRDDSRDITTTLAEEIASAKKDCCPDCKDYASAALATLPALVATPDFAARLQALRPKISRPLKRQHHSESFKCSGKAGEIVIVEHLAYAAFRGEKIIATDTHKGEDTRCRLSIAGENQGDFFPPSAHSASNFDCGIALKIAEAGDLLSFEVEFLKDSDFTAVVIGSPRRAA